jgi:prepilin-type N-terminal cleavage/methylation domain-containing protein
MKRNDNPFMAKSQAGFTLLELIVVMGIFIVVIMISSQAFERIIKVGKKEIASNESNIQGVVGLEILRADLEKAGYGLPWPAPSSPTFVFDFEESQVGANVLANGIDPAMFNDKSIPVAVDAKKVPRAIQSAAATGAQNWENGRDYIVIKGTSLGLSDAAKRWGTLEGLGAASTYQITNSSDDVKVGDRVITLKSVTEEKKPYRELLGTSTGNFSYTVAGANPPAGFRAESTDIHVVYGVEDSGTLRAPYNRVDYYIKRPTASGEMPARCAPGTGVLYKAHLNHSGGGVVQYPLLECVADMQVVYSLDTNEDGGVDLHSDENILASMSSETIRRQLKEVRVYVLAQEGNKDMSYSYSSPTVQVGGYGRGRSYDLTALNGIGNEWRNYRWRIYTVVAAPKNINN